MKIKYLIFLSIALGVGALGQDVIPPTGPVNVRSVDFKFSPDRSRLEISMDNATGFVKNVSEADRQVIIEIQNAQIPAEYARKLDTSNFKSNVAIISPYQSGDNVRVVLQLKNNGGVDVTQEGNKLVAFIDNGTGGEAAPAPLPATPPDAATAALLPPADNTAPPPLLVLMRSLREMGRLKALSRVRTIWIASFKLNKPTNMPERKLVCSFVRLI